MGFGYDRPWRIKSAWDKFAIPRLGSAARAVLSDEIYIPENLNRTELDSERLRIEEHLNRLSREAEDWASCKAVRTDGVHTTKKTIDLQCRRDNKPIALGRSL